MRKIFLIFFGPQGSGKGTQASQASAELGLLYISTGALLRAEVKNATDLGKIAGPIMNSGELVPDDIILKIIEEHLCEREADRGAVFDGFPRNLNQQQHLLSLINRLDTDNEKDNACAILIDVSDEEVKKRVESRRSCVCGLVYHLKYNPPQRMGVCDICGRQLFIREDDKPETLEKRLALFHKETKPLLDFWRKEGKLIVINGEQSPAKVKEDLFNKLRQNKII